MVKRSGGGTKRKIKIEKIAKKESLATGFTKRRNGLYSKVSQLCLLADAQIAVLATPSSSNSNVSFFSFGHSSVDAIVTAYLTGQRPVSLPSAAREDLGIIMARKELGLGLWWEDELLASSKNAAELTEAINSMSTLLQRIKEFRSAEADEHETLISHDLPANNSAVLDQELEDIDELIDFSSFADSDFVDYLFSDSNDKNDLPEQTLSSPVRCSIPDDAIVDDFPANWTEEESREILAICEGFCKETDDDFHEANEEDQSRLLAICDSLWV